MSIQSKQRRDLRKKLAERLRHRAEVATLSPQIEAHAELRDQQRTLLAGIVRRDGEWVLGMDGRIAGQSESAAQVLSLIMQAAEMHERTGTPVRLMYSDALKDAAHADALAQGLSFEEFKARHTQIMRRDDSGAAVPPA
ncbi:MULTISPECIES: hypothetical protein [unclassified Xanthomonas]|uniref:hypothetical protein n=1 Tax=unclassified Xanthomonas TaxID=2643310 RepID=UPI0005F2C8B0|nr:MULTISPECIES: hypothetical protein [unclassified Xanthomonas]